MNKILGMVIPYIIIIGVILMQSVVMEEIIVAIVIGLLIGLEFLSLKKAEGTVLMKFGKILTICIFVVAFLLGLFNQHLMILPDLTRVLALLIPIECINLYMIYQKNHKICEFAFSYFITFRYNHFIKYKGVFLWLKLRKKAK